MGKEEFLKVEKLCKSYGEGENKQEVLKDLSFTVSKGEFCVLLGPSGSGKTTLLNILGGIDSADSGYVSIDGDKLEDMDEKGLTRYRRKHFGYEDKGINSLYILLTNIVVVIFAIITSLLAIYILNYLFRLIMYSMSGWFSLFITPLGVLKMIIIILVAYIVVAYLDMRQIKKVPLNEALKNVE